MSPRTWPALPVGLLILPAASRGPGRGPGLRP